MKRLVYKILLSDVLVLLISVVPIYISYLTVSLNFDDNILYSQAYQNIHLLSLSDAYIHYKTYTGGSEVVYFILSYVSSYYLTYAMFVVSLNAIFLSTEDVTSYRLGSFAYKDYYEGNMHVRILADKLINFPFIGRIITKTLSIFASATLIVYK